MRQTEAYKFLARVFFKVRTTARRTIWGDRLFLQFRGPTTILMSSRGARVSDVLTNAEVNEIADAPAGAVPSAVELATKSKPTEEPTEVKDAVNVEPGTGIKDHGRTLDVTKDLKA